ncbi:MAG TPA: DUF1573 domain-containing protein [Bacteroidota bacterium]|nr:DUF1573 domain-containing protein [Bacteroidota bacterium]
MKSIRRIVIPTLLCLALSSGAFPQASLVVREGMNLDFGLIYTGRKFVKNVTLLNIGADTLEISKLSASCGCTGTLLGHDKIAPRDSTVLTITFNSSRFSGIVDKAVTMNTNDPTQPNVRIVFTANVVRVFAIDPEYIVFRSTPDSSVTDTVSIQNISSGPIRILSAESTSPLVKLQMDKKALASGETLTLLATFSGKEPGTTRGNINIRTDQENLPTLEVRFFSLITRRPTP